MVKKIHFIGMIYHSSTTQSFCIIAIKWFASLYPVTFNRTTKQQ